MVGDPQSWYAQRDGGDVHEAKWTQQVVLYAVAMMETRGERPEALEQLEGCFDGVAVHFGVWCKGEDGVRRFEQVASYVLPNRQLPPPATFEALPAPKVI